MRPNTWFAATGAIVCAMSACVASAAESAPAPAPATAPAAGKTFTLDATADVGISSYVGKTLTSNGAGPTTPIRQNQNWEGFENKTLLLAFDTAPIKGWTIGWAELHLCVAKGRLHGVGLCEVLAPWAEPATMNWLEEPGGPCWLFARTPKDPKAPQSGDWWAWPGSGIYSVTWAHPMARYYNAGPGLCWGKMVDAAGVSGSPSDPRKRFAHMTILLNPFMVASMAAGTSYGMIVTDDKGQVAESYSLLGPGFPYRDNDAEDMWLFTRDVQEPALRPRLVVHGEMVAKPAPPAIADLKVASVQASTSTVTLEFTTPDDGVGHVLLAYDVRYASKAGTTWEQATPLPRWAIPLPGHRGQKQTMPIWTLRPGQYEVSVRGVDRAGARGAVATVAVTVPEVPPARLEAPPAAPVLPPTQAPAAPAPPAGDLAVYAVPDMVKIDPVGGFVLRDGDAYREDGRFAASNPVFQADCAAITVDAPANAAAAFQLIIRAGSLARGMGVPPVRPAGVSPAAEDRSGAGTAPRRTDETPMPRPDERPSSGLRGVRVAVTDLTGPDGGKIAAKPNIQCFRVWYVKSPPKPASTAAGAAAGAASQPADPAVRPAAWHGDACLPLREPFGDSFAVPAADNAVDGQTNQAVWVDVFVPKGTPPGDYAGKVTVSAEGGVVPVTLALTLRVLPLTLSDQPTWPVELNCYGRLAEFVGLDAKDPKAPQAEWEFYRLAKAHRLMFNSVPYGQRGTVDATRCPVLAGEGAEVKVADWSPMDSRLGPLLDGSAFSAEQGYVGPGAGTPISHIYLPFHENWPLPLAKYYRDYAEMSDRLDFAEWAWKSVSPEKAFPPEFEAGYASVARQFAEHIQAKGWTGTTFQFFLNNKYYYKVAYFSAAGGRGGSSFWLLDEPVDYDDYAANAFFLGLARKGVAAAAASAATAPAGGTGAGAVAQPKFAFRVDVSQPEMSRGLWNGVVDLWMCGYSAVNSGYVTTAAVRQKWLPNEAFWHYGGGPPVTAAPVSQMQTFLASWCSGSAGILPYWTTLGGSDWTKGDDLAIYYTGKNYAGGKQSCPIPLPGVRMKVLRRCQQDVELLMLLAAAKGWDRPRVRAALAPYADDPAAPVLTFNKLTFDKMLQLRSAVAHATVAVGGR